MPKQITSIARGIQVGTASQLVLEPSEKRRAVMFMGPTGSRITLTTNNPAVDGFGIMLQASQAPIAFTEDDWGDLVKRAWYGIAGAANTSLGIVESFNND